MSEYNPPDVWEPIYESPRDRFDALVEKFEHALSDNQYDVAAAYATSLREVAARINESFALRSAAGANGMLKLRTGHYEESAALLLDAAKMAEDADDAEAAGHWYGLAATALDMAGLHEGRLVALGGALRMFTLLDEQRMVSFAHLQIAEAHADLQDFDAVLRHLDLAKLANMLSEDGDAPEHILTHEAALSLRAGRLDRAIELFADLRAKALVRRDSMAFEELSGRLADALLDARRFEELLDVCTTTLYELTVEISDAYRATTLCRQAQAYYELDRMDLAYGSLVDAEKLFIEAGVEDPHNQANLTALHYNFADWLEEEGRWADAQIHWQLVLSTAVPDRHNYIRIRMMINLGEQQRYQEALDMFDLLTDDEDAQVGNGLWVWLRCHRIELLLTLNRARDAMEAATAAREQCAAVGSEHGVQVMKSIMRRFRKRAIKSELEEQ